MTTYQVHVNLNDSVDEAERKYALEPIFSNRDQAEDFMEEAYHATPNISHTWVMDLESNKMITSFSSQGIRFHG